MTNTYKLAKIWKYLLIVPSISLVLLILIVPSIDTGSEGVSDYILPFLIVSGIAGCMIYMAFTSKVLTSSEGIEYITLGIRIRASWNEVERIDVNPYGVANLVFKDSIYKSKWLNTLFRPLGYDRTIQLSPYVEDLASSNLLKDIAKFVPDSNIPEFVVKQKRSVRTAHKAGVIGLYYLILFVLIAFSSILFQKRVEGYFVALGFSDIAMFSDLIMFSLFMGLLYNAMTLLSYNSEIENLSENQIAHRARAHYLSPLVITLTSILVGIGIRTFLATGEAFEIPFFVELLIGAFSLRISIVMEKFLFQDNVQEVQGSA